MSHADGSLNIKHQIFDNDPTYVITKDGIIM